MGPWLGWLGGWAIVVADIIVMANLSADRRHLHVPAGRRGQLRGSTFWVTLVGVLWIVIMTAICYIGVELSARTQWSCWRRDHDAGRPSRWSRCGRCTWTRRPARSTRRLSWLNPFEIPEHECAGRRVLVAVFIYWGWDSTVTVNEESNDPNHGPGLAAIVATLVLVGIYVIVSVAAQAYAGPDFLINNSDDVLSALGGDVLGSPLDKLLIIAVLTSASASTQTTILPTTRTVLSMAYHGPRRAGSRGSTRST